MEGLVRLKKVPSMVFFFLLSLFIVLPFITLVIWSVTKLWPWPSLLPETFSFDSWNYLFSKSGRAFEGLFNSLVVAGITVLGNILLGLPAAKVLSRKSFFGKTFAFIMLLSPLFIPVTVVVMGLHEIAIQIEFLNDYILVAIAHIFITLPYFITMVAYQFLLMGTKMQEAARSLGASGRQVFIWIELPQLFPALLLALVFVSIISFSQYLPTWIMSGGTLMTLPLIIFPFASSGNASIVAAYSIWFFLPIMVLVLVYFFITIKLQKKIEGE